MAEIQKSDTLQKELQVKQKWIIQDENLVDFYKNLRKMNNYVTLFTTNRKTPAHAHNPHRNK